MDVSMAVSRAHLGIHCYGELRSRAILPLSKSFGTYIIFRASYSSGPVRYTPGSYSRKQEDENPYIVKSFVNQPEDGFQKSKLLGGEDSLVLQDTPERSRLKSSRDSQTLASLSGQDEEIFGIEDADSFSVEHINGGRTREIEARVYKSKRSIRSTACKESAMSTCDSNRVGSNITRDVLAGRDRTMIQLRKKLPEKKISADAIEPILSDFQDRAHAVIELRKKMLEKKTADDESVESGLQDRSKDCGTSVFRAIHPSGTARYMPGSYYRKEEDGKCPLVKLPPEHPEDLFWKPKLLQDEESLDLQNTSERSRFNRNRTDRFSASLGGKFGVDKGLRIKGDDRFDREDIDEGPLQAYEALVDKSESSTESIDYKTACNNDSNKDASNAAIEVLAGRAHTVIELRRKLRGRKFSADVIESVISNFQDRGLLNDFLYAETFAQSHWLSMTWGPRRIKQSLITKGVSEGVALKALKQVFEEDDSSSRYTHLGMSADSVGILFERVSKNWLRTADLPEEKRKARITRWLQYRGFDWQLIAFIVKKLETKYPSSRAADSWNSS